MHARTYYKCNRFTAGEESANNPDNSAAPKDSEARIALKKYLFYFTRVRRNPCIFLQIFFIFFSGEKSSGEGIFSWRNYFWLLAVEGTRGITGTGAETFRTDRGTRPNQDSKPTGHSHRLAVLDGSGETATQGTEFFWFFSAEKDPNASANPRRMFFFLKIFPSSLQQSGFLYYIEKHVKLIKIVWQIKGLRIGWGSNESSPCLRSSCLRITFLLLSWRFLFSKHFFKWFFQMKGRNCSRIRHFSEDFFGRSIIPVEKPSL